MRATINTNSNTSDVVDLGGVIPVGLYVPNTFVGGSLTFQTSLDATTFAAIQDGANTVISVTVGSTPLVVPLSNVIFTGIRYVKLVSNTNQNQNTSITILTRK